MFTVSERDAVREHLLELAAADPLVAAAALTGSSAVGAADDWSDIDLVLGIQDPLPAALTRWTELLYRDFDALHHWDLPSGSSVYRVYLLPDCLEVDIAFTPIADFGPRGPSWRTIFGEPIDVAPSAPTSRDELIGHAWHHALHARTAIERRRLWQAEYWISGIRDQVLALACLRLGHPSWYAKGAHLLPAAVTEPLAGALVRSMDEAELRRALREAISVLTIELELWDEALVGRLRPILREVAGPQAAS